MLPQVNKIIDKIRQLPLVKKHPNLKEMAKYSLVGNLANIIDFGLYIYLTRAFFFWRQHYLIANLFTMLIASTVRFTFHKHWTFRDTSQRIRRQYGKFILVMILGLGIDEAALFISVEYLNFYDLLGKIVSMVVGTFIIYYLTKKWVFNNK